MLIAPSATRDRLTAGMYLPKTETEPIGCLEAALDATIRAEAIEAKMRAAQKAGTISATVSADLSHAALAANVITAEEEAQLRRAVQLRDEVIRVDHFPQDFGVLQAVRPEPQRVRDARGARPRRLSDRQ